MDRLFQVLPWVCQFVLDRLVCLNGWVLTAKWMASTVAIVSVREDIPKKDVSSSKPKLGRALVKHIFWTYHN